MQGRTESAGIVLAAHAGPRVPSGGVTHKRRCTYRPSVIYLIVNKLLFVSLSLSVSRCSTYLHHLHSCGSRVTVSARDDLHCEMQNMQSRTNHLMDLKIGATYRTAICTELRRGLSGRVSEWGGECVCVCVVCVCCVCGRESARASERERERERDILVTTRVCLELDCQNST